MAEAFLEVEGLDAGYEQVRVVRDVHLTVHAGEIVTLLGPNGAGKTTTLRAVCGLLPPFEGRVTVMGTPLPRNRPAEAARRGMILVPENRALFFGLTVRENLRLGGRGKRANQTYDLALHHFPELQRLMNRRAGLLSGGEQQMLTVARALVAEPKLLVVDEMSLGLAPLIVQRLIAMLKEIATADGPAILFVEQYVDLALSIADRAYVMQHGTLVLDAPAAELRERRDVLTTSYLGDKAVLEGD